MDTNYYDDEDRIKPEDYLFVAALDFGTTYSGYAFSSRSDYRENPMKMHANQAWNAGGSSLFSLKTPTSLLLDSEGEFVSFGYEAENKHGSLVLDGDSSRYLFFSRFKMKLHNRDLLKENTRIPDISGKPWPAKDVFMQSIKALKDHLMERLTLQGFNITIREIRWVLTVPAIWSDSAKKFMRRCAELAGIPHEFLFIALEPEVASVYCQHLPNQTSNRDLSKKGTKYMIIDVGGGTADITVHENLGSGRLRELHAATGGACGGTAVDREYNNMLTKIIGTKVMIRLAKHETSAYLDIFREFESAKRLIKPDTEGWIRLTVPYATVNALCEEIRGQKMEDLFQKSSYAEKVIVKKDKINIDASILKTFFEPATDELVVHIKEVIRNPKSKDVTKVLLVGGCAESKIFQNAVSQAIPGVPVIVPEEAELAVLKGAVIFGHNPKVIKSRILRYTYGTEITPNFIRGVHPRSKLKNIAGINRCLGVFKTIMSAGTEVELDQKISQMFLTATAFQFAAGLSVYCSPNVTVEYTDDDSCFLLGRMLVELPVVTMEQQPIFAEFCFGDTELTVTTKDMFTQMPCKCSFKLNEDT
ncbi:heat shock 70 kDa protein 12A-like isoform X2 [Ostrea edulis]|nr:heat shock 70 kDa protein 12A-like isoform X2 [Ostrea edulis]XP_055997207.1 heat shock 70 kDa protein 12A-like isoform X2 [Ostrea edulis]XP_055997208.1 heat shock 70 kDa protein 12A-like isoform X2 [Ostrea edulis]